MALIQVDLRLISGSVLTGAVLLFVDTMKELPATLVLRSFNFNTLASFVFRCAYAALPEEYPSGTLTIVVAGKVRVILPNHIDRP